LRERIHFDTKVTAAAWDDDQSKWMLTTASGEIFVFDVVVACVGMFNELHWPRIDGIESFEGRTFHSARWDVEHRLDGERVGVIGSAASAVQLIPEVARVAGLLSVFQRSPNWVLPKEDVPWTTEQIDGFRAEPDAVARLRTEIFEQLDRAMTFSNPARLAHATAAEIGRA